MVHVDKYGVRYFLKRIDDYWINVFVVGDTVKTACIIGLKTYRKLRERRWCSLTARPRRKTPY